MTSTSPETPSRSATPAPVGSRRSVHPHGVDFVAVRQRIMASGELADRTHGSEVAIQGIKALEQHDLGAALACGCQQLLEMTEIIVSEYLLCTIGLVDAFDHRVVVQFVGEDQAVRNKLGDRRDAGLVCAWITTVFWLMPR
jgi:hypothetical protein